jgi:hypothetical protein
MLHALAPIIFHGTWKVTLYLANWNRVPWCTPSMQYSKLSCLLLEDPLCCVAVPVLALYLGLQMPSSAEAWRTGDEEELQALENEIEDRERQYALSLGDDADLAAGPSRPPNFLLAEGPGWGRGSSVAQQLRRQGAVIAASLHMLAFLFVHHVVHGSQSGDCPASALNCAHCGFLKQVLCPCPRGAGGTCRWRRSTRIPYHLLVAYNQQS